MTETRMVFVGALDLDHDASVTISIPPDASPEEIVAAIERANVERAKAAKRESEALAALFLDKVAIEREPPK